MIAAMADAGLILPAYPFVESQIQPASLDLRLGDVAYRVRASFLPGPRASVRDKLDRPFNTQMLETVRGAGYRLHVDERGR